MSIAMQMKFAKCLCKHLKTPCKLARDQKNKQKNTRKRAEIVNYFALMKKDGECHHIKLSEVSGREKNKFNERKWSNHL